MDIYKNTSVRKYLSIIFVVASIGLQYLALKQIHVYEKLFDNYGSLEDSRENGYAAQIVRLEPEIDNLKSKIDGNLQEYFTLSYVFLVFAVVLDIRRKKDLSKES